MRFFVFVLAAVGACAEPVVSNVDVLTTHGTVRVVFRTSDLGTPRNSWIDYGTTPDLGNSTAHVRASAVDNNSIRTIFESGLQPSTQYFFRVVAVGPTGTSNWRCTEGGLGWTCDPNTGLGIFVTENLPEQHPAPPESIAPVSTQMPAIDGQTFEVSLDENGRCQNLAQQIRACAAADTSLNHQVLIPAGATCVGRIVLPVKSGPGTCVVRTATPDTQLPPEGVRIDPSYADRMANIVSRALDLGQIERAVIDTPTCGRPVCTEGWRFVGIHFTGEDLRKANTPVTEIADVSQTGIITTVRPHGLETYHQIYVSDVEGFDGRGPNGIFRATTLSPTTFRLQYGGYPPIFTCAAPPCYRAGTGRVSRAWVTPVSDATNTQPVVLKTPVPHGLSNPPRLPISSASNPAVTIPPGEILAGTVKIENSSVPEWNGYWAVLSSTPTTVLLRNVPSTPCLVDCGTIRRVIPLQVAEVEGNRAVNGTRFFTVLSPTEIQLDDVAGDGDYSGGGIIALDPDLRFTIVKFGRESERMILDRSYVDGGGFPNRTTYGVVLHASNSGIVDSYIENIDSWRMIHPYTGRIDTGFAQLNIATSSAIEISLGKNKKIDNNFISAHGITVFSQEGSGEVIENIQITRNRFYSDPKYMAGSPVSNGLYYPKRHHLEFKRGRRVLIEGNIIDGNWADATPCGPSLALSIRGNNAPDYWANPNVTSDFLITNNIFRNVSSGIQIVGSDSISSAVTLPTRRIRIHNNLFYNIDNRAWASKPSLTGGGICGFAISTAWPVEDLLITNNTAEMRGSMPQFFNYSYGRSEGVVVRSNIFTHNGDNNAGALQPALLLNQPGMIPVITGSVAQAWSQYFRVNSDFSFNVIIPGVRNTNSVANYTATTGSLNFTRRDCELYYAGFLDNLCAGEGNSLIDRLISIFEDPSRGNYRIRGFEGKGADIDAIERAIGAVRSASAEATSSTDAVVAYYTTQPGPCHVDYTDNPQGDCRRVMDNGTDLLRTVALTNLQPSTRYFYRIQCPSEQVVGEFRTLP